MHERHISNTMSSVSPSSNAASANASSTNASNDATPHTGDPAQGSNAVAGENSVNRISSNTSGTGMQNTMQKQQQQQIPTKSVTSRSSELSSTRNTAQNRNSKLGVPTRGPSATSNSGLSAGASGGHGHHGRKKLGHHGSTGGRMSAQELIPEKPKIKIPALSVVPIPELGEYSQQQFGLRKAKDVGDWQPRKLIARDALLADIASIGYISDFYPLRELIQRYPGKEMLIYYDTKMNIFGQDGPIEYFLITHEQTKQFLTTRTLSELPRPVLDLSWQSLAALRAAKANKKWESLGSEFEIIKYEELKKMEKFEKIVLMDFSTRLSQAASGTVNHRPQLSDWKTVGGLTDKKFNLMVNVHVDADEAIPDAVPVRQVDACSQTNNSTLRRDSKASETGTSQQQMVSALVQAALEPLSHAQRDQILCREDFFDFLSKSVDKLSPIIKQNCLADYYYDEWEELPEEEDYLGKTDSGELKEVLALIDLSTRREDLVSHVDVHLGLPDIVFASLAFPGTFDERSQRYKQIMLQENVITVFSCWDPIRPIMHLYSPDEVQVFAINPSNPFIIAGGCANGQLVVWDLRSYQSRLFLEKKQQNNNNSNQKNKTARQQHQQNKQSVSLGDDASNNDPRADMPLAEYCVISDIEKSHKMAITDLHWLSATLELDERGNQYENEDNFSYQIVTASADSSIAVWDIRPQHVQQILPQLLRKGARQFAPNENLDELCDSLKGMANLSRQLKPFIHIHFKLDMKRPAPFTKINMLDSLAYIRLKQNMVLDEQILDEDETTTSDVTPLTSTTTSSASQQKNVATTMNNNPLLRLPLSRRGRAWQHRRVEADAPPLNTFWFGTEYGELAYGRLVPLFAEDNATQLQSLPLFTAALHDGPITAIERSPFARNIVLITGGYTFTVWQDDHSEPLMQSPVRVKRLSTALWSSTRAAVFYVARLDGNVEVWDLLDRTDECVRVQSIAPVAITCLSWVAYGERKHVLACSDQSGATHLVDVPRVYRVPVANERQKVQAFFEREIKRQQWAKSNLERIRLQMEKEKAIEAAAAGVAAVTAGAGDAPVATAASPVPAAASPVAAPTKKPIANMNINEMLDNMFNDDEVMTQFCNKLWTNFQSEKREWEQQLGLESDSGGALGSTEVDDEGDENAARPRAMPKSGAPSQMSTIAHRSGKPTPATTLTQRKSIAGVASRAANFETKTHLLDIIPDVINDADLPKRVESLSEIMSTTTANDKNNDNAPAVGGKPAAPIETTTNPPESAARADGRKSERTKIVNNKK